MDIVSYSKVKKAKKATKKTSKLLGRTDKFKNNELDVKDRFTNVDERLSDLEKTIAEGPVNTKVSELTANTMINLNKHNLKVASYLSALNYRHKNMLFDDLKNTSNIYTGLNVTYDTTNGLIKKTTTGKEAYVTFSKENVNRRVKTLAVSLVIKDIRKKMITVPASLFNFSQDRFGFYQEEASFISDIYDTNIQASLESILLTIGADSEAALFYSDSNSLMDNFSEWTAYENYTSQKIKRYVRFKFFVKTKLVRRNITAGQELIETNTPYKDVGLAIRVGSNSKPLALDLFKEIEEYEGSGYKMTLRSKVIQFPARADSLIAMRKISICPVNEESVLVTGNQTIILKRSVAR